MKNLFIGLVIGTILFTLSSTGIAAQLNGTVVKVEKLDVIVKVDGELMPSKGDQIELSFTIPDGESIPIGTWEITRVTGNMAVASVKRNTGDPVVGHKAVIFSENPMPQIKPGNVQTQGTYTNTGNTINTTNLSGEAQQVIEEIRSNDPGTKRNGAKIASKRFSDNTAVMAVAAEELKKGFSANLRDGHHVDAMAWLCNALGASYDQKYAPLLRKVYKESRSKKIRKYAKKNYNRVR